jgi:hypothetical protein
VRGSQGSDFESAFEALRAQEVRQAVKHDLPHAALPFDYRAAVTGRCAFKKLRTRLIVRAFSSGGSFQG